MPYAVPTVHRLAYDRDNTVVLFVLQATNATTVLSLAQRQSINSEIDSGWTGNTTPAGFRPGSAYTIWLFPYPIDLTHYFIVAAGTGTSTTWQWSTNTTDGLNGTWNDVVVTFDSATPNTYRTIRAFTGQPFTNVRGLRFLGTWADGNRYIFSTHLYGTPTGANPDQLQIWNPSTDVRVSIPDLGALPAGVDGSTTFRVKNVSAALSTTSVVVSANALTDTTVAAAVDFSLNGSSWSSTVNVGDLAPGAISALVYMRVNGSDITTIGAKTFRIITTGSL